MTYNDDGFIKELRGLIASFYPDNTGYEFEVDLPHGCGFRLSAPAARK